GQQLGRVLGRPAWTEAPAQPAGLGTRDLYRLRPPGATGRHYPRRALELGHEADRHHQRAPRGDRGTHLHQGMVRHAPGPPPQPPARGTVAALPRGRIRALAPRRRPTCTAVAPDLIFT